MSKYFNSLKNSAITFVRRYETLRKTIFVSRGFWHIFLKNKLFSKIKYDHKGRKNGKKVLLFSLRTIPTSDLVYVDALFGHAFKKLGCDVKMLYCDGLLDSCDSDSINQNQKISCSLCKSFGSLVRRTVRLDSPSLKDYITDADIDEIREVVDALNDEELIPFEYLGVDVGQYAKSATIRYFLEAILDMKDPFTLKIFRKKLVNSMIVSKIADETNSKEKPELVFMLHGIYSTWGPFYKYFRNKNVDVIVFNNRDERFGYSIFNRNGCQFDLFAPELWKKFNQEPFRDEDKKQIDSFLYKRFNGLLYDSLTLYKKAYNNKVNKEEQLASLQNSKYMRRYVLFSNVFWDAVVEDMGSPLFEDIVAWIIETVGHFLKRPNFQLIIKPHPGELGGATGEKTRRGVADYIALEYPNLPDNIYILNADTPLTAYDLMSDNMIGLTFNGTLGLELATKGIPAIVAGNCHYKEAGVVYSIQTIEEYFSILDQPDEIKSFAQKNKELARKYAYYYFYKTMVRLPLYSDNEWLAIDWKMISDTEKLFQNDSGLMKIIKNIVDGKDVLAPM